MLCQSRRRWVAWTPEEEVRQRFILMLTAQLGYPQTLVGAEIPLIVGARRLRADIVVWDRQMRPLLLVECKAPSVGLTQRTLDQACGYLATLQCRAVCLTNGKVTYCALRSDDAGIRWVESVPSYDQL